MKKILLFLMALTLSTGMVSAEEKTILTHATSGTWTGDASSYTATIDGFEISYIKDKSTNDCVAPSADHIRVYKNAKLVVKGQNGENITKIVLNCTAKDKTADMQVSDGSKATADGNAKTITWEGFTSSFEANTTAQVRVKSIVVTYTYEAPAIAAPVFSLEEGAYTTPQTLTITAEEGCSIYYTDNGDDPTNESTKYEAPITIDKTTTIKAIAYKDATQESSIIVAQTYTFPIICENIAAFKQLENGTEAILNLKNAQVLYAATNDVFIKDESGVMDLYQLGLDFKTNQILNGHIAGKLSIYNEMPEMAKTLDTNADNVTVTDGEPAVPTAIELNQVDDHVCDLVTIECTGFDTRREGNYTNTYAQNGTDELIVYNKFRLEGFEFPTETGSYKVTGIIVTLKSNGNILKEIAPIKPIETSVVDAIENVVTEGENANAPMYNLAGQRVNESYKGIVIQNGKKKINK